MFINICHGNYRVELNYSNIRNIELQMGTKNALERLFSSFLKESNETETFAVFYFTDHIEDFFNKKEYAICSENAKCNSKQAFMQGHDNVIGFFYEEYKPLQIYYNLSTFSKKNNFKSRFTTRDFVDLAERQINSFYTRGYLTGLQLANITKGFSFVHACAFSKGEDAILVAATPGAGKSSLLLSIADEKIIPYNFIADDFALIDNSGYVHHIGRPLTLKSHHLQYFKGLNRIMDNMPLLQKIQWRFLQKRGLRYLAKPSELFGEKIDSNRKIKKAIYLTNHNEKNISVTPMFAEEFALLNANMIFSELMLGFEIINRIAVLPCSIKIMNPAEIINKTRDNIRASVSQTECLLVKVPFRSDPKMVYTYLKDNGYL